GLAEVEAEMPAGPPRAPGGRGDEAGVALELGVLGAQAERAVSGTCRLGNAAVLVERPRERVVGVDAAAGPRFLLGQAERFRQPSIVVGVEEGELTAAGRARKGVKRKPGPESDSGCYVNFPALMIPMLLLRPLDRPIRARTHCRDERAGMAQPIRVTSREVSLLPRPECERSSPACDGRRSAGSCQTRCCC